MGGIGGNIGPLLQEICNLFGCNPVITKIAITSTAPGQFIFLQGTNFGTVTGQPRTPGHISLQLRNFSGVNVTVPLENVQFGVQSFGNQFWAAGQVPANLAGFRSQTAGILVTTSFPADSNPLTIDFQPLMDIQQLPMGQTFIELVRDW